MSVTKVKFGECDKGTVYAYILDNGRGLCAEILDYGGIIRKLTYLGTDVVLGRDTLEEYLNNSGYFGALVGRNANRILNAQFELNGKTYNLFANNGKNNLHGGKVGFDKKIWTARTVDSDEPSLELTAFSPDGEEGFPGNLNIKVTYTLTKQNGIKIHYEGESDADTVLNMTNHTYFNLGGHSSGAVDSHKVWLDSDFYTPNSDECVPTGEILSVKGTPFDFSGDKTLGEKFAEAHEQITKFGGFDHNLVLNGRGFRKVGALTYPENSTVMEIYTDQPGLQLYSGNKIEKGRVCKDGAVYDVHGGICFETQVFPNNLTFSHFPSAILRKGEKYDTVTEYRFLK